MKAIKNPNGPGILFVNPAVPESDADVAKLDDRYSEDPYENQRCCVSGCKEPPQFTVVKGRMGPERKLSDFLPDLKPLPKGVLMQGSSAPATLVPSRTELPVCQGHYESVLNGGSK